MASPASARPRRLRHTWARRTKESSTMPIYR